MPFLSEDQTRLILNTHSVSVSNLDQSLISFCRWFCEACLLSASCCFSWLKQVSQFFLFRNYLLSLKFTEIVFTTRYQLIRQMIISFQLPPILWCSNFQTKTSGTMLASESMHRIRDTNAFFARILISVFPHLCTKGKKVPEFVKNKEGSRYKSYQWNSRAP